MLEPPSERDPSPQARSAGRRLSLPGNGEDRLAAARAAGEALAHPRGKIDIDKPDWYGEVGQKHLYAWGYGEHGQARKPSPLIELAAVSLPSGCLCSGAWNTSHAGCPPRRSIYAPDLPPL